MPYFGFLSLRRFDWVVTVPRYMPGFAAPIALDGGARGATFPSIRLGTVAGEMATIATTIANVATAAGTLASEMTESLALVALRDSATHATASSHASSDASPFRPHGAFAGEMPRVVAIVANASAAGSAGTSRGRAFTRKVTRLLASVTNTVAATTTSTSIRTVSGNMTALLALEAGKVCGWIWTISGDMSRLVTTVTFVGHHVSGDRRNVTADG